MGQPPQNGPDNDKLTPQASQKGPLRGAKRTNLARSQVGKAEKEEISAAQSSKIQKLPKKTC